MNDGCVYLLKSTGLGAYAHGIEEASSRGGGVDALIERHEVSPVLSEDVCKLQEFAGVPGKAGQLRKYEASDVAPLDVCDHPLGFGVGHYGFAADCLKVVDLDDVPTFDLCVCTGAMFVE